MELQNFSGSMPKIALNIFKVTSWKLQQEYIGKNNQKVFIFLKLITSNTWLITISTK